MPLTHCPRCQGNLLFENGIPDIDWVCLQCGFREQAKDWEGLPNWWPATGHRPAADPVDGGSSTPAVSRSLVHVSREA